MLRTFFESLGDPTCTYRLFHTEEAENASRDKPSALISDYVTVMRTGRVCRRCLSTVPFTLHSYSLSQDAVGLSDGSYTLTKHPVVVQ